MDCGCQSEEKGGRMPRLKASTLIEAMVAAVIFLIVFAVSMQTISKLTVKDNIGVILIEADYRTKIIFNRFTGGEYVSGSYVEKFDWGEITTVVCPYRDYTTLQLIAVTATINNSDKRIEYREIIEIADE